MALSDAIWHYIVTQYPHVVSIRELAQAFPTRASGYLSQSCTLLVRQQRLVRVRPGHFRLPAPWRNSDASA